jgi:formylglycine-generating enzyme required for sulfatase activity
MELPQVGVLLSSYRTGELTLADLIAQLEQLLTERRTTMAPLLAALEIEHARAPLAPNTFKVLMQRVRTMDDRTLLRVPSSLSATAEDPRTELLQGGSLPTSPATNDTEADLSVVAPAPGSLLAGRFGLSDLLGQGGMSQVYKAVDMRKVEAGASDPHVAVKVLTVAFDDYTDAMALLQRETDNLRALTHPNIVRVIDCDRDGATVFMTLEYLQGKSLGEILRTPGFAGLLREDAGRIIEAIASALDYAHEHNVVHGDLKPGNVMITENGSAKVIDFGIARLIAQPVSALVRRTSNRSDAITGLTPAYASPEMLQGEPPDPRDDVYGLACMAWEMLTGGHPFERNVATLARDRSMQLQITDRLTRREYRALQHALAFERAQRTPTVRAFIDELTGRRARHRMRVAAASGAAVLLAIGAVIGVRELTVARIAAPVAAPSSTALPPGTVFRDCPTCPLMTVLPAGSFNRRLEPQVSRAEVIGMPFAIAQHEVTVGEFAEFVAATQPELQGCEIYDGEWKLAVDVNWMNAAPAQTALHPVTCVSWEDASAYARWLSQRTQQHYRLPKATEWEYAALGRFDDARPWRDDTDACIYGNVADRTAATRYPGWTVHACSDEYAQAAPVGSFAANAYGLHDLFGNVFEWLDDCSLQSPDAGAKPECIEHESRGGSWFTEPQFVRASYRNSFPSTHRSTSIGLRVVREIRP